jgi:uncharacterized protein YdeI (BOF family)
MLTAAIAVTASPLQRRTTQISTLTTIGDLQRTHTTTVSGEVVQVWGEDFILRDATGQMLIEAEWSAIRQANLKAGDRVTIMGSYDDDSFEAIQITLANGNTIDVFDD